MMERRKHVQNNELPLTYNQIHMPALPKEKDNHKVIYEKGMLPRGWGVVGGVGSKALFIYIRKIKAGNLQ